ncbi:hypothetical protein BD769DRAFT_1305619, partial [Suillus cothurnatus]
DDIFCGVDGCRAYNTTAQTIFLRYGDTTHKEFPTGHYILPDINVMYGADTIQMDLYESNYFTPTIVVLQTIMEE